MDMIFCQKWRIRKKKPINIFSREEAQKRHKAQKAYSVVLSEDKRILYVLDVVKNCVIVNFMNESVTPYLIYDFQLREDGRVFLKGAIFNEFTNGIKIGFTIYNFHENGYVVMAKHDLLKNTFEERNGKYNVDCNWDVYPSFGDYSTLLRVDRETK